MEPITIVGLTFRLLDGVEDVSSFWDMLEHGRNVMSEWPENRANIGIFYMPGSGVKNTVGLTKAPNLPPSHLEGLIHKVFNKENSCIRGEATSMKGDSAAFDAPFFSITAHGR